MSCQFLNVNLQKKSLIGLSDACKIVALCFTFKFMPDKEQERNRMIVKLTGQQLRLIDILIRDFTGSRILRAI
jgi:hypothetical protein